MVSKGNYVAVVCEREEQAINAARQLKANWEKPAAEPFPSSENLFKYMRDAAPTGPAPTRLWWETQTCCDGRRGEDR